MAKILLALVVIWLAVIAWPGLFGTSEREQAKKAVTEDSIGLTASIAAGLLVSAFRSCQIVGVPNIEQCAGNSGKLIDEISARTMAELAVAERARYWLECLKAFSQDYCSALIRRAVDIEQRKPPSKE